MEGRFQVKSSHHLSRGMGILHRLYVAVVTADRARTRMLALPAMLRRTSGRLRAGVGAAGSWEARGRVMFRRIEAGKVPV